MKPPFSFAATSSVFIWLSILASTRVKAATWEEGVDGDLSSNQSVPSLLTLSGGSNSIIGTVGGPDGQDWITITVPIGFELSALNLETFGATTDSTAFTGVAAGSVFAGDPLNAGSYLGYTHFGPGNVGTNLLPAMASANLAQGFTLPLPAGDYAFLIQQTGPATTAYQFDCLAAVAVPEPSLTGPGALCGLFLTRRRRRSSCG